MKILNLWSHMSYLTSENDNRIYLSIFPSMQTASTGTQGKLAIQSPYHGDHCLSCPIGTMTPNALIKLCIIVSFHCTNKPSIQSPLSTILIHISCTLHAGKPSQNSFHNTHKDNDRGSLRNLQGKNTSLFCCYFTNMSKSLDLLLFCTKSQIPISFAILF